MDGYFHCVMSNGIELWFGSSEDERIFILGTGVEYLGRFVMQSSDTPANLCLRNLIF